MQLNVETAAEGHVVFGGRDAENYRLIPSVPLWKEERQVAVGWNSILVKATNDTAIYPNMTVSRPVTLDSGCTLSTLPGDMFNIIAREFRVKKSGDNYYSPCDTSSASIQQRFGGSRWNVIVPYSELSIPANPQPGGDNEQNLCMFGFRPASSWGQGDTMLSSGDTILRSAYLLVDYDNMMMGVAQANQTSSHCTGTTVDAPAPSVSTIELHREGQYCIIEKSQRKPRISCSEICGLFKEA